MKDGIIKGEGTSRLLKAPETIPNTFAEFRTALINGTLPVDVLFNAVGWDVIGTALNKANLLTDAVATALGLTSEDPTVNEAINALLAVATPSRNGMMSKTDKTKLDGVANNANNYSHPTGAGYNHIPSGGSVDSILGYSANGLAIWIQQLAQKSLLSAATAGLYGLTGVNANADKALEYAISNFLKDKGKSLTDNGYAKIGNLIVQWCTTSGTNSTLRAFPISFPNNCFAVSAASASDVAAFAISKNKDGFYASFGNQYASYTIMCIAVGY